MDCRIIEIDSMKTQNIKKTPYRLVLILLLFISEISSAQPSFSEGDDVQDVPVNSIDFWIVPMFIVGILLLFYYYKKSKKIIVINPKK
jgi:hypothetical protein